MCYTIEMTEASPPKPWHQLPDEPPDWYDRFHTFLNLGPSRSLTAAYREWTNSNGKPSSTSSHQYHKWRWKERAMAYDQAKREEKAAFEAARESEAREQRIRQNNTILQAVAAALDAADLKNLTTEEARQLLPSLRVLYATTSELQRRELQSTQDTDHLPASSDWPVLDEESKKVLHLYNADEK